MKSHANDARGFAESIVKHLKDAGEDAPQSKKVQSLLLKMSSHAQTQHVAQVESAIPLSTAEIEEMVVALSRIAGTQVRVEASVNTQLIAGIRIQMDDWVMDTSFRQALNEMAHIVTH